MDVYKIALGESITHYMASRVGSECNAFLFIITPVSVDAVNHGTGNISFEMQLATAHRLADPSFKVIGVFRKGSQNTPYLQDRKYIDFRDDQEYDQQLNRLAEQLKRH